jgi:hypothetical protein
LIKESEHEGWPYLVLIGDRSRELGARIAEYVSSLEPTNPHPQHLPREIEPMPPEAWLATYAGAKRCDVAVVVVLGPVSAENAMQLEHLQSKIGDRCLIVIDAEMNIGADWKSIVRLQSRLSWESYWAEGIKILLSVLLLPAVDRGMVRVDPVDLRDFLKGHGSYLLVTKADGSERMADVMTKALQRLAAQENLAAFDTLIVIAPTGPGIPMREIHTALTACWEALPNALSVFFLPDYEENGLFSVSLIAGVRKVKSD